MKRSLQYLIRILAIASLLMALNACDGVEIDIEPITGEDPEPENPVIVPELQTGLRTMYISTPDGAGIYSKDIWTEGCSVLLVDDDGKEYYRNEEVDVKGRGNSTWTYDKKPYTLKLTGKEDLLDTGAKGKRYVLLANWMDRTLLRNDVAFELARRSGMEWTPSGEFIELYLDGKHLGNYWLGEMIKVGKGRLDADWLIEMDTYYDAMWRFYSGYGMPIGVKHPDDEDITEAQFGVLKSMVDEVERAIYLGTENYRKKIDVPSFIDWYLVHEVTCNAEPNHPKSCYFYFRGGKMYAGPVWDFDWGTFQQGVSGLLIPGSIYFGKLLDDREFVLQLKARWEELKLVWNDIPKYIDARAAEISASESINWQMWPCTNYDVNGDTRLSFPQAIQRMKLAFANRVSELDKAIAQL